MSRIGKLPVDILEGVKVTFDGQHVTVTGPKGTLEWMIPEGVVVSQEDNVLTVSITSDEHKNLWGLTRSLLFNMIEGVAKGFEKKLQILGVGYAVKVQGQKITLNLGYSHPIDHELPKELSATVEKDPKGNDVLVIQGADKQLVGEHAAKIRAYRKPEPYKGKGVRYLGEYVRMKAGKTATKK